jgi:hypothetical protein
MGTWASFPILSVISFMTFLKIINL